MQIFLGDQLREGRIIPQMSHFFLLVGCTLKLEMYWKKTLFSCYVLLTVSPIIYFPHLNMTVGLAKKFFKGRGNKLQENSGREYALVVADMA